MSTSTSAPIVVVTGANTGIGFETVRALVSGSEPYTVILCARNIEKGEAAAEQLKSQTKQGSRVVPLQLDIEDDESINQFVKDVEHRFGRVDVLINNAGVGFDAYIEEGTMTAREAWNSSYNINVTSTQVFTTAVMPLLFAAASSRSQSRILFVSSTVASHAWSQDVPDLPINCTLPSGWPKPPSPTLTSYRTSKTALGMVYREWCRVLANDPIKCHLVCPGLVATNFGGETPEQARARGAKDPAVSGVFFRDVVEGKYDEYAGLGGKLISEYIHGKVVEW